jgi:hypothetical protein
MVSGRRGVAGVVFTFEDPPDATGADRLIAPERRGQLGRQRRVYLKTMAADVKATGWSATFEGAAPESVPHRFETGGGRHRDGLRSERYTIGIGRYRPEMPGIPRVLSMHSLREESL